MSKVSLKRIELSEDETVGLQQFFLDKFLLYKKFTVACKKLIADNELGNESFPRSKGFDPETVVAHWIEEYPEFRIEFDKAKKIVARVGAVKAEEFLNEVGSGQQKTGKDAGISTANVVAGHMVLEADDKARWSSKVAVEKTETRTITTIVKHYGLNDSKVETIDSPEVKELPVGDNDDSNEE